MANANGAMSPANDPTMKPNENSVAIAGATSVTDCMSTSGRRRAPAWRSVFATSTSVGRRRQTCVSLLPGWNGGCGRRRCPL